jgi:hypothetical protein
MSSRWVVDPDHPQGYLVSMTPAEQAQYDADQAANATSATAAAQWLANEATITTAITTRLAQIRTARTAISNGTLFASLTANEKAVIDGLLADDIYLARLTLDLFDATS